jgi:O-antigen/teichoic acid export membrane protein
VLLVFLVGRFTANAAGASGLLLSMTNNQYTVMWLDWGLAVSNVVLTYVFVLEFGLVGAALGTSTSMVVQNALQVGFLLRYEGLWPFDRTFLRPIAAGVGMTGAMIGFRAALDGPVALVVGPVAGLLAFVGLLAAIGTGPRDRLVVSELAARYRR